MGYINQSRDALMGRSRVGGKLRGNDVIYLASAEVNSRAELGIQLTRIGSAEKGWLAVGGQRTADLASIAQVGRNVLLAREPTNDLTRDAGARKRPRGFAGSGGS